MVKHLTHIIDRLSYNYQTLAKYREYTMVTLYRELTVECTNIKHW